jgi:hypothetical protein
MTKDYAAIADHWRQAERDFLQRHAMASLKAGQPQGQDAALDRARAEGRQRVHARVRRVMNAPGIKGHGERMSAAGIMACDKPDMAEDEIIRHVIATIPQTVQYAATMDEQDREAEIANGNSWRDAQEAAGVRRGWKQNEH